MKWRLKDIRIGIKRGLRLNAGQIKIKHKFGNNGGKTTKKVKLRTNCEKSIKLGINMIPNFL